ncbi:hypothetical protein WAI453_007554 [Rhynchosporium graminicola]
MRASISFLVTLLFASSACARVIPAWMITDPTTNVGTRDIEVLAPRHSPETSFEERLDDRVE